MTSTVVVVGGGVAGLVSALIARRKGANVTVVEQAQRTGGLWHSEPVTLAGKTHVLDHGLRLPLTSGLQEWDDELFHNPRIDFDWLTFEGYPREGALFRETFTHQSSCFDARLLGPEANAAGLLAMIAAVAKRPSDDPSHFANDADFIAAHYGINYRDQIFAPILRGFLRRELHELAPGVSSAIVPRRLIATDLQERERLVSQLPELANVLAHSEHAALPTQSARKFIYPQQGHISCWIKALQSHLEDLGVKFVFGLSVKQLEQSPGEPARVTLSNGAMLQGDHVVWSLPLVFVAMMRPDLGMKPIIPEFLSLGVHHIKLDRAVPHRTQYLLNFNSDPTLFRVVFRDNLLGVDSNILTIEQLLHLRRDETAEAADTAAVRCIDELKRAGVLAQSTEILDCHRAIHRNFLPILTPPYTQFNRELAATIAEKIPALVVVGRAGNGALFLDGIILDALEKLGRLEGVSGHDRKASAG